MADIIDSNTVHQLRLKRLAGGASSSDDVPPTTLPPMPMLIDEEVAKFLREFFGRENDAFNFK